MVFARLQRIYSNGGNKKAPLSEIPSSQSNGSNFSATDLIVADVDNRSYCLPFGTRTRFVILLHLMLCVSATWSNVLSFNFAVICMVPAEHETGVHPIDSHESPTANQFSVLISNSRFSSLTADNQHDEGVVYYSPSQRTWLTSIVAVGAVVSYLPIVLIVNRFQVRVFFTLVGLLSAIATGLLPIAITHNFPLLLFLRFLQGIGLAANFPVIGGFNSKWAYYKQNGLFVSTLVSYVELGPGFTNLISPPLCTHVSWQSVFYVHAAYSAVVFVLFGAFFRNSPNKHPLVGEIESSKIARKKSQIAKAEARSIPLPLRSMLTSRAVWAAWIGAVGNFFAVNLLFLYSDVYLSRVLGFSTSETGVAAVIPAFGQYVFEVFCGVISDRIRCVSDKNKLRFFNSVGLFGVATSFAVLAFLDTNSMKTACMVMLMVATTIIGSTAAGFFKCTQLISAQFSYIVTGALSFIAGATMLLVPILVGGIAPDNRPLQWRWVFIVSACVLVITNTIFCVFCSAEPCIWTTDAFLRRNTTPTTTTVSTTIPEPPPVNDDKNAGDGD